MILAAEVAVIVLAVMFLVAHGILSNLQRRARERTERGARAALTDFIVGGPRGPVESALRRLPFHSQSRVLVAIGRSLGGSDLGRLRALAMDLGVVERARREARSPTWHRRLRGARLLTLLDPAPNALAALLDDPHDAVRSQAIEGAADRATPEVIEKLIELLADRANLCRFAVQDTLLRIGPPVIEPLARHLERASGTEAEMALRIALGMPDHRFLEPAIELSRDPSPVLRAGAAEILGAVGGTAPLIVLEALLDDPAPSVRAATAIALGKLQHWRASERLAALLRDRQFEVRRAAALGLGSMGAAGELVLRQATSDADPFAADMARLALEVAASREIG